MLKPEIGSPKKIREVLPEGIRTIVYSFLSMKDLTLKIRGLSRKESDILINKKNQETILTQKRSVTLFMSKFVIVSALKFLVRLANEIVLYHI